MRVIACMSWYAEANSWLAASVTSAANLCDHLIAVDGAYALFPEGRHRSGTEQHAIIQEAALASGMGVTIHTPADRWMGNEVEKRTFMFRLAESVSTPLEDWYMILDADEVVLSAPSDLRKRLEDTELDVGEATLVNREDVEAKPETAQAARQFSYPTDTAQPLRIFFRAIPGLAAVGNHYTNKTPDGRVLWGNPSSHKQEPCLDLRDVVLEHRTNFRTVHRNDARKDYYARRDKAGIERNICHVCGSPESTKSVTIDWRRDGIALTGQEAPTCDECYPKAREKSRYRVRKLGFDPDGIVRGRVEIEQKQ